MKTFIVVLFVCIWGVLDSAKATSFESLESMKPLDSVRLAESTQLKESSAHSQALLQTQAHFPLEIKDFWHSTIFDAPAKTHIFLSFCEMIAMLDIWEGARGLSRHVFYEPLLRQSYPLIDTLPKIGGGNGSTINPEILKRINPDVVFVWAGDKKLVDFSRKLGVKMIAFYPQSIYELFATLYRIALVFDKQEMYLKKQDKAFEMIELITSRTKSLPHKKRAIYIWDKLTSISGRVGMVGDMLEIAGLDSMGKDMRVDSYQTNVESILRFDPEVIFIWGGSSLNEATLYANPQLKNITAIQNKKVYKLPIWDNWGPRIVQTSLLVSALAYPTLFDKQEVRTQIQNLNLMWFGLKEFSATIPLLDEPQ